MRLGDSITIVSVSDNHYVVLLAALLKSIEINHKSGEPIDFYIVEDGISESNKKKTKDSINKNIITIHWISLSEAIPSNILLPLDRSSYPLNIYVRLWIPEFIPANINKVIYLDVDMLVIEDISKLWQTDIGNKAIAAVKDRPEVNLSNWERIKNFKELGLTANLEYFNSGLLILNLNEWRKHDYTKKIIQCIKDNIQFADFPDQYGLNVIFANQWFKLSPLWNCHASSKEKNPNLIHFSSRKPIYRSYNNNKYYQEVFDGYLAQTLWGDHKPISEYKRLLKKLYNKFEKYLLYISTVKNHD